MIEYMTLDPDQYGNIRVQSRATLGDGMKVYVGIAETEDEAREIARLKAERGERALAALEVHDPEDLEHFRQVAEQLDLQILKAPDGTLVEATGATVAALLAAGYEAHSDQSAAPQRTNEHAGPVEVGTRGQTRRRKPVKAPDDEM